MKQLNNHPQRTLAGLLALSFALFMLSGAFENGPGWLGDICWFGWMVVGLVFVGSAIYTLIRSVPRRRNAA